MFFYVSLVLVIVAAITLVIGLLSSGLPLVIVSIISSFLAGIFLILTVMRERPRAGAPGLAAGTPPLAPAISEEPALALGEEEFPIEDYDDLRVSEIVPLLPELDDDELDMVREREEAGKARATILNRVDDLMAEREEEAVAGEWEEEPTEVIGALPAEEEFPIEDYDDLRVNEIVPLLPELDDDELDIVREREASGKARAGILNRIDEILGVVPAPKPAAKRPAAAAKSKANSKKPAAKAAPKPAAKATGAAALPIRNYDSLSAPDVAKRLAKLGSAELKAVRTYEKRTKARKTVLDRIESELSNR